MKKSKINAIAIGLMLMCSSVFADTQTANMNVTATVGAGCDLQANDLNFGIISLTNDNYAQTTMNINCPVNILGYITINEGLHNITNQRRLAQTIGQTDYFVDYLLFSDPSYSDRYEAFPEPGAGGLSYQGAGQYQQISIYGEIPPQASQPNGLYTDIVQVRFDY